MSVDVQVMERFWSKVEPTGFCWLWTDTPNDAGYGRFRVHSGLLVRAHRFSYELMVGPIPEGLTLDHLCRITICVNPDHLEPVTNVENILRSFSPTAINARKVQCQKGHPYTPENTYVDRKNMRHCRPCGAEGARRRRMEKRVAA